MSVACRFHGDAESSIYEIENQEKDMWSIGMRMRSVACGVVVAGILAATPARAQSGFVDGDPKNGLSSQAFRRNALTTNQRALEILRTHSLRELFAVPPSGPPASADAAYIAHQLHDPNARAVASELVKCALPGSVTVNYTDPIDSHPYQWHGELGLCQPSTTSGWLDGPPTEACQEIVSACITARVNALQKAIPLSLRGLPANQFQLREKITPATTFRESPPDQDPSEGTPIPGLGANCGPDGDCQWKTAYVGTCAHGPVTLDVTTRIDQARLRVCAGIHGCMPQNGTPPPYAFDIKDATVPQGTSSVEFSCPQTLYTSGFYSVMIHGTGPVDRDSFEIKARPGHYPASETEIFRFVEGAFYGNLFQRDKLLTSCEVDSKDRNRIVCLPVRNPRANPDVCTISCGVTICRRDAGPLPYSNIHACYSRGQEVDSEYGPLGVAYLNSRICDRPDATCFFEPPVPCSGLAGNSARCTWMNDAAGYQGCKSPTGTFSPITTVLNEPCDLIGEGELCNRIRKSSPIDPHPTPAPPRPDSCGGCARSCSAGGALALLAGMVLLVILRRRKRSLHDA